MLLEGRRQPTVESHDVVGHQASEVGQAPFGGPPVTIHDHVP